jgi:hypothetical protein
LNFHWLIAAPPPAHILSRVLGRGILTYRCASLFNAIGKEPDFLRRLILIFTFANLSLGKKIPERRSFNSPRPQVFPVRPLFYFHPKS